MKLLYEVVLSRLTRRKNFLEGFMKTTWKGITVWAGSLALGLAFGFSSLNAHAGEVVLYSSNQPELLDVIAQGFKEKTGHTMTSVRMGTGEAMKRIAAERANPLCDVFWSGDVAVLDNAKADFAAYKSPEAEGLPATMIDKEAKWIASNTHLMVFMVNTKLIPENEAPRTWADLLDPRWKGKIVMANPEKSGTAYAQVYGVYKMFGDEGLAKLVDNATILDSSSLVYKGTAEGEFALGITLEYAAYRYVAGGNPDVKIIYPSDGVISAPEGAALVKGCQHPAEARQLVDYLLSKEVEEMIFQKYYRRPAREDTATIGGLPDTVSLNILKSFDPAEASALKGKILAQWKKLVLNK